MNTTVEHAALEALANSPLAQRALDELHAEQHAIRRAKLDALAAAEREMGDALAAAHLPLPGLRAALAEARQQWELAAAALRTADHAAVDTECAHGARVDKARQELSSLGDEQIETTRRNLLIERRIAANADEWRPISRVLMNGATEFDVQHLDNGGSGCVAMIDDMLAELDGLLRDPEASPAAIEQRCAEMIADVESGRIVVRVKERTTPENMAKAAPRAIVRRAVSKYLHR